MIFGKDNPNPFPSKLDNLIIIEGMACLGKTTFINRVRHEGHIAYVVDFQKQLNECEDRHREILQIKGDVSFCAGAYASFLAFKCMRIAMSTLKLEDGVNCFVDRWTISDFLYNAIITYSGDYEAIIKEWERLSFIEVIKLNTPFLKSIKIYSSSEIEHVRERMRQRGTELDKSFLSWNNCYVTAQHELWKYLAKELGLTFIDVKKDFIC